MPSDAVKSYTGSILSASSYRHFLKAVLFIEEKYRPGLGIQCLNVPGPVPLLVFPGQLMLFNRAVKVIINAHAGYQAVLLPAVHNLGVEIETGAFILLQDSRLIKLSKFFLPAA